ncbi:MAG: hypothetical protein WBA18_16470 [Terracidiphilus sp.]
MRRSLTLLLVLMPLFLSAQTAPTIAVQSGVPQFPIHSLPATMVLIPKAPGAHPGKIWVRSSDQGLSIWGQVQVPDNDLRWPTQKSEMLKSDHVEIWLSASPDVQMPPVGYGNQFGEIDLKNAADCEPLENGGGPGDPRMPKLEDCRRWYNEQLEYRKQFERLFTRQWLAAGNDFSSPTTPSKSFFEDFATGAWANLEASLFDDDLPKPLKPQSDGVVAEFNTDFGKQTTLKTAGGQSYQQGIITGYSFHFFIPFTAFPPAQQLRLRDLYLMVDVFSAAPEGKKMGAMSTTSAERLWGKPKSFNHVVLDAPRDYEISPCNTRGVEEDMYGVAHRAWYFPLAGEGPLYLRTDYDIENPAGGYMYDPAGVSPIFKATEHFWKVEADGSAVCGPKLEYRKGAVTKTSEFYVAKEYFETQTLPDGWMLVRSGPDMSTQSPFGSGACGACPVVDFHVYSISPKGEIARALDISDEFSGYEDQPSDGDFAIAPDWRKVTYYRDVVTYLDDGKGGQRDDWSSMSYCLEGHAYRKCSEAKNVSPPDPRNFQLADE